MSIAQGRPITPVLYTLPYFLACLFWSCSAMASAANATNEALRIKFQTAWNAARSGPRSTFVSLGPELTDYTLYPYWQYEDYRHRRAQVAPAEMADFLAVHEDWAFAVGLRRAWLKTLGKQRNWSALLTHGVGERDTVIRCYVGRARIAQGETDQLMAEARALWTVGQSQPDECDPLFAWFRKQGGITRELAWERIRLAMESGNPRLTLYLARFLPAQDQEWLDRWQRLDQSYYRNLDRAVNWRDNELTQMIAGVSLKRLSRRDSARAISLFKDLDGHFQWSEEFRGEIMREIALMAGVDLEPHAPAFIRQVPEPWLDDQLHEWWARVDLSQGNWSGVISAIEGLEGEAANDDRWRYWRARAQLELGEVSAGQESLRDLATRTNYYGFLSADLVQAPYTICPLEPDVAPQDIEALATAPRFLRALELHATGLENWAAAEWSDATRNLPLEQLKVAAALARQEGWHDRVIFALGNSGELRFYEWRFPVIWETPINAAASQHNLDASYLLGIMRSESAMVEAARSSAGALGLMQVTPGTARMLAGKHGLSYQNSSQLLSGETNIRFGSVFVRDLLDDFDHNPVLVSGAYNAGPHVVERWLNSRPQGEAAIWIETLPYYETRDYIPRVLTFTTLYDWRLENPVPRISSRMPGIDSGNLWLDETVQVVCRPDAHSNQEPVATTGL